MNIYFVEHALTNSTKMPANPTSSLTLLYFLEDRLLLWEGLGVEERVGAEVYKPSGPLR